VAAICVFCASSELIAPSYVELAGEVGARLAAGGHSLVYGGGRVSMMGAVARAARAGGAPILGVVPQALVVAEDADESDVLVVPTMRERKRLMDDNAAAFLALPGGLGTLEELLEVWTSGALGMHAKPVVVLDVGGFFRPLWSYVDELAGRGFVRPAAVDRLHRVESVTDAFAVLEGR
jgi:uncharacterized protein (TIGR00730 family)